MHQPSNTSSSNKDKAVGSNQNYPTLNLTQSIPPRNFAAVPQQHNYVSNQHAAAFNQQVNHNIRPESTKFTTYNSSFQPNNFVSYQNQQPYANMQNVGYAHYQTAKESSKRSSSSSLAHNLDPLEAVHIKTAIEISNLHSQILKLEQINQDFQMKLAAYESLKPSKDVMKELEDERKCRRELEQKLENSIIERNRLEKEILKFPALIINLQKQVYFFFISSSMMNERTQRHCVKKLVLLPLKSKFLMNVF